MRNLFDQYEQPENKLTHALVSALAADKKLIRPFLHWLRVTGVPALNTIKIGQQHVPGKPIKEQGEDDTGLPDACFYGEDGWAVLIESKVQAGISIPQLRRHVKTAGRYGYDNPTLILLAVDGPARALPSGMWYVAWKEVYAWFARRAGSSDWARRLAEYIEVLESKMIANDYNIRGTLTMFNGFHFDEDHPYTYHEGKRLLRLARQELLKNTRLVKTLQLDSTSEGRPAITRGQHDDVWDFIPLKAAKGAAFTGYPHVTVALLPSSVQVLLIVPNGATGTISKLKNLGFDNFCALILNIEKRLRPITQKVPGSQPMLRALQRHYKSQRSIPVHDGELRFDLRALRQSRGTTVKYQPTWAELIYELMTHKRTNIQMAVDVYLPYSAKVMQSPQAIDVIAETWIAMKPFLDFVLPK